MSSSSETSLNIFIFANFVIHQTPQTTLALLVFFFCLTRNTHAHTLSIFTTENENTFRTYLQRFSLTKVVIYLVSKLVGWLLFGLVSLEAVKYDVGVSMYCSICKRISRHR